MVDRAQTARTTSTKSRKLAAIPVVRWRHPPTPPGFCKSTALVQIHTGRFTLGGRPLLHPSAVARLFAHDWLSPPVITVIRHGVGLPPN